MSGKSLTPKGEDEEEDAFFLSFSLSLSFACCPLFLPSFLFPSIRYCLAGDDKREKRSLFSSGMDEQGLLLEIAFLENDEKGSRLKGVVGERRGGEREKTK